MGVEPIIEALDQGAQIIVTGRCYDPAVLLLFRFVPVSLRPYLYISEKFSNVPPLLQRQGVDPIA